MSKEAEAMFSKSPSANVLQLFMQIFVVLQMILFNDSLLMMWFYDSLRYEEKMSAFYAVGESGQMRFSSEFHIILQSAVIPKLIDIYGISTDPNSNSAG